MDFEEEFLIAAQERYELAKEAERLLDFVNQHIGPEGEDWSTLENQIADAKGAWGGL